RKPRSQERHKTTSYIFLRSEDNHPRHNKKSKHQSEKSHKVRPHLTRKKIRMYHEHNGIEVLDHTDLSKNFCRVVINCPYNWKSFCRVSKHQHIGLIFMMVTIEVGDFLG